MTNDPKELFVQRIAKNFLDILILRLIQTEPMWGYKIIKKTKKLFNVELRHGALYPLLNSLENEGYTRSERITKEGRVRKVYQITPKGIQLLEAYNEFMKEQLKGLDIKEA